MKADEIRDYVGREAEKLGGAPDAMREWYAHYTNLTLLGEIAAQLAELNEKTPDYS